MKQFIGIKRIGILVALMSFQSLGVTKIEVFYIGKTLTPKALNGVQVDYYHLEEPPSLNQVLEETSTQSPSVAEKQTEAFLHSRQGEQWKAQNTRYYAAINKAFGYQLKGVPAIVLDSEKVIYGTTDIKEVLRKYALQKK